MSVSDLMGSFPVRSKTMSTGKKKTACNLNAMAMPKQIQAHAGRSLSRKYKLPRHHAVYVASHCPQTALLRKRVGAKRMINAPMTGTEEEGYLRRRIK